MHVRHFLSAHAQVHGPKETWSTALRRLPIGNLTRKQLNRFLGAKRRDVLQEAVRSNVLVAPRAGSMRNRSRLGMFGALHRDWGLYEQPLGASSCETEGTPVGYGVQSSRQSYEP